jgi:anaerobic magnesium-protoporphyrin IX monomethyl ester cyclase
MQFALVNPNWTFDGSIYFGCQDAHLPLEYGYAKALLEQHGHEALIIDGLLEDLSLKDISARAQDFNPDFTVVTTAPSYLFWRCAPPELRVPQQLVRELRPIAGTMIAVGPHASTTPGATLSKLGVDAVVMGECEEALARLAETPPHCWSDIPSLAYQDNGTLRIQGALHASDMQELPPLRWPGEAIKRHCHHHHRFDAKPTGPGAEMETSRGCPYRCSFCAKENFRNRYRRRPLPVILEELDGLLRQGVEYVYFIDEIFLPNQPLLEALIERPVKFGVQTRIDLWDFPDIELLGRAGCVSIEAGVESLTEEGRRSLDKNCKLATEELSARLIHAKRFVPFVQANLILTEADDSDTIESWRSYMRANGIWANMPVPLFPYPGSPDYAKHWGPPDDYAWERALDYYLEAYRRFSDIQEGQPLPLSQLELPPLHAK